MDVSLCFRNDLKCLNTFSIKRGVEKIIWKSDMKKKISEKGNASRTQYTCFSQNYLPHLLLMRVKNDLKPISNVMQRI